jgi:hypothetical protein
MPHPCSARDLLRGGRSGPARECAGPAGGVPRLQARAAWDSWVFGILDFRFSGGVQSALSNSGHRDLGSRGEQ